MENTAPSPNLFFDTLNAYEKTAALKAALDLDLFTAIGSNHVTSDELAAQCQASPRGVRILADFLVISGFLRKADGKYSLTQDSSVFLDRKSPAYAGGIAEFLLDPTITQSFKDLTGAVRKGGTVLSEQGTMAPEHSVWLQFARSMGVMMMPVAKGVAGLIQLDPSCPTKILDISASHGAYGISVAHAYPASHLVALDWEPVLAITTENAKAAGLGDRFTTLAGDAFATDWGGDYDVILIPNFLHHFSAAVCTQFLKKVLAALRPGGKVVIVDFVPNDDRVTPPPAAGFSLVMLGTTEEGDAYTFAEFQKMLSDAGFPAAEMHLLPPSAQTAILAQKPES